MSAIRFNARRNRPTAEVAHYAAQMARDNSREHSRLKRNLLRAMQEELTPRQRQVIALYYGQKLTMQEIGERIGVDRSTVCRTLHRGEQRLYRCLRYGVRNVGEGEDDSCHEAQ